MMDTVVLAVPLVVDVEEHLRTTLEDEEVAWMCPRIS